MRRRDLLHDLFIDVLRDQSLQRSGRCHCVRAKGSNQSALLVDVVRLELRRNPLQDLVVFRSKKRKRRHQRSGADSGDRGKLGPIPRLGPAEKDAGCKGAACAPARDCEIRVRATVNAGVSFLELGLGPFEPVVNPGRRRIPPHAGARNPEDPRVLDVFRRERGALGHVRACRDQREERDQDP